MAEKKSDFVKALDALSSQSQFPVLKVVRENPQIAAVISKLITSNDPIAHDEKGNRSPIISNAGLFKSLSNTVAQDVVDSDTTMQMNPDLRLASQILVSSILSPKDLMTTELTFSLPEGVLPTEISTQLIAKLSSFFDRVYKINPLLSKILEGALFDAGSFPIAVIPENSLDEIINGMRVVTTESIKDHVSLTGEVSGIGLLGAGTDAATSTRKPGLAMEGFSVRTEMTNPNAYIGIEGDSSDSYIRVSDNFNALKIPFLKARVREQNVLSRLSVYSKSPGLEGIKVNNAPVNDRTMHSLLYKDRHSTYKPIVTVKTQDQLSRGTVGNPLVMHIPPESVIPVYVPGDVSTHVGYFILLDIDGNPVSKDKNTDYYNQIKSGMQQQSGGFASALLQKSKTLMSGFDLNNKDSLDFTTRTFTQMVEQDLINRLKNGVYGDNLILGKQEEIYRIMLARSLSKQYTQMLFIPAELMTYFAFNFNDDGIGISLLSEMKIINGLRAMLTVSSVMGAIKNSIGRTAVGLKLDETDPNPLKTIETGIHEILATRQRYLPIGISNPGDISDWLTRAAYEFSFTGHPQLPDVTVDFSEKNSNYAKPDQDLMDDMRKKSIMGLGVSPETVDATFQSEFAIGLVNNNLMFSRRVLQWQDKFLPQVTDHLRKFAINSSLLIEELREVLLDNFDALKEFLVKSEELNKSAETDLGPEGRQAADVLKNEIVMMGVRKFLDGFESILPRPNSVTLSAQMEAFNTFQEALDKGLEAYISDSFFTSDVAGEVSTRVTALKEMMKAHFTRLWMNENGMLPELGVLTSTAKDGEEMTDIYKASMTHIAGLTKNLAGLLAGLSPIKAAADKVMTATGDDSSSDSGSGNDSFSQTSDDGFGGMDGFGGDMGQTQSQTQTPGSQTQTGDSQTQAQSQTQTDEPKGEDDESLNAGLDS